jgi:hypothetical protein
MRILIIVSSVLLSLLLGCSTDGAGSQDDSAGVIDARGELPASTDVTGVDAADADTGGPDVALPSGLKAHVVEDAGQLLMGPGARGRIGDLRIENDFLAVIIGSTENFQWGGYGGGVLDMVPTGGEDYFTELFPIVGFLRGVKPEKVVVLSDGSDGTAVIRMTGTDRPIPIIDGLIKTDWLGTEVTVDYILEADSRCLEIRTTVVNGSDLKAKVALGDGLSTSDEGRLFGAAIGYDNMKLLNAPELEYIGSETLATSYLLVPEPSLNMSLAIQEQELSPVFYGFFDLAPGESRTIHRCLYVGSGRSSSVLEQYWESKDTDLVTLGGTVTVVTPEYPISEVAVELVREGDFAGAVAPSESGEFQARVPAGDYSVTVTGDALPEESAIFSVQKDASIEVVLLSPARVDAKVKGPGGQPIPARLSLQPGIDAADTVGIVEFVVNEKGEATFFVAPGNYTLLGSRGPFWSLCRANVSALPAEAVEVECEIEPAVDVAGTVSADLHTHSGLGIDSTLHTTLRVLGMLAEGIQFFASTDHDIFLDFRPLVEELGLAGEITNSPGSEVSLLFAHINCLGCPPQTGLYFEAPWLKFDEEGESAGVKTIPQVFDMMRDEMHAVMIQINHFREGTALFNAIDYDPELGPSVLHPDDWSDNFDALEVWNSGQDLSHLFDGTLLDWYSLLNRGMNKVATGNSDSHALTQWAGQPRNLINSAENTEDSVYAALAAFDSQVTSAPVIEFSVDGAGIGKIVVPDNGGIDVVVKVRAADWVPLSKVRLVANGDTIESWDVEPSSDVVRFEFAGSYEFTEDTWLHVLAYDEQARLYPIYPGRESLAFTQPIWIDLAGDGFDPPIVD